MAPRKPAGKGKTKAKPRRPRAATSKRPKAKPDDDTDERREPWEQQPKESAPAFQAFARYRDQDPAERSIRAVARALGKSGSLLSRWSVAHDWQHRCAAWDLEQDRIRQRELEQERVEAARRHARTAQAHLQVSSAFSGEVLRRALAGDATWLEKLPNDELLRFALQAARATPRLVVAERLSLGISTENVGGHDGGPLTPAAEQVAGKTDDELDEIIHGRAGNVASIAEHRKKGTRP